MKRTLTFFIFLIYFLPIPAQEKLGIANSNYSSINSIFLNPASSVDSRTFIQANLVSPNIFALNNEAFLPSFNLWAAAKGDVSPLGVSTTKLNKFLYTKVDICGPEVIVSTREIGFGFFVRGRVEADVRNIPYDISNTLKKQVMDTSKKSFDLNIRNLKAAEMSWVEYGVNFGKMYFKHSNVLISWGGNLKYLTGINIAYADIYRVQAHIDHSAINISDVRAKMSFNQPGWNTGKGLGTDLGVTYKKTLDWVDTYFPNSKKSNCKYIDYRYKIGVSLLDLGAIRFAGNTYKGTIAGHTYIDNLLKVNPDSILQNSFQVSKQTSPIWATLPTALSVQADWNMTYYLHSAKDLHFYVNTSAVQGLTMAGVTGVQRANTLSVTPRYERRNIEIAVPLTLYGYLYPQVGLAFRFRTFVLGMDNVLPLVVKNDTYGVNVYFGLGISMFKNPACKAKPKVKPPKKQLFGDGLTFMAYRKGQNKGIAKSPAYLRRSSRVSSHRAKRGWFRRKSNKF